MIDYVVHRGLCHTNSIYPAKPEPHSSDFLNFQTKSLSTRHGGIDYWDFMNYSKGCPCLAKTLLAFPTEPPSFLITLIGENLVKGLLLSTCHSQESLEPWMNLLIPLTHVRSSLTAGTRLIHLYLFPHCFPQRVADTEDMFVICRNEWTCVVELLVWKPCWFRTGCNREIISSNMNFLSSSEDGAQGLSLSMLKEK